MNFQCQSHLIGVNSSMDFSNLILYLLKRMMGMLHEEQGRFTFFLFQKVLFFYSTQFECMLFISGIRAQLPFFLIISAIFILMGVNSSLYLSNMYLLPMRVCCRNRAGSQFLVSKMNRLFCTIWALFNKNWH